MSADVGNNGTALTPLTIAQFYTIPSIYLVTGIGLGVIYLPNLVIMVTTREIRQHSSYKIMIVMGVLDFIQLSVVAPATAVFILTGYPDEKTKFAGAVGIGAYFGYTLLLALLSFDRCLKTWSPHHWWPRIMGGQKLYVIMTVGGVMALWFTIVLNFNTNSFLCSAVAGMWYYKEEGFWNIGLLDQIAGAGSTVFMIIMYSLIGIKIRMMRGDTTDTESKKQELNILCHAGILLHRASIHIQQVGVLLWTLYVDNGQWSKRRVLRCVQSNVAVKAETDAIGMVNCPDNTIPDIHDDVNYSIEYKANGTSKLNDNVDSMISASSSRVFS